MECCTYRSSRRDGVYLYTEGTVDLTKMPDDLVKVMGRPVFMLKFELIPGCHIAKVNPEDVIREIKDKGYFLRIDCPEEDLLNQERARLGLASVVNDKLVTGKI